LDSTQARGCDETPANPEKPRAARARAALCIHVVHLAARGHARVVKHARTLEGEARTVDRRARWPGPTANRRRRPAGDPCL
jgi:hypothetical protein